jgi:FkbH-like protein
MKLIEALEILKRPVAGSAAERKVFLACGFTPLHLQTFLAAHLRKLLPEARIEIETGRFGDLTGNLERLNPSEIDSVVVAMEWSDLDSRQGIRTLGGWRPADLADIVESAAKVRTRLQRAITGLSEHVPVVVCMPTLPLPPMFPTQPVQAGAIEMQVHQLVASFAEHLSQVSGVRIANPQLLALRSSPADRYDVKSDLTTGFPYTLGHASVVGEVLAELIQNRSALKGLITDLDDTLWAGIVGDDGVDGISWDLDHHTQMHGLYQQVLSSLAGAGVLIGVASRNDAAVVERAFERKDLLLSKDDVFPLEIHWSRKSESVGRILSTWNIGADAVIFVDDNAMELAEVRAAFPEMVCRVFPKGDPRGIWELLAELRTSFGKPEVTKEDALRLSSIRDAAVWRNEGGSGESNSDDFLRSAEAWIAFECGQPSRDARAFELVNKTNQFNLNGVRFSESEWRSFFRDDAGFALTASYGDKFGALGTIAVVMGTMHGSHAHIKAWVMSCRAFSRRIEYQCLKYFFENLGVEEVAFDYQETARNGPMREFLSQLLEAPPAPGVSLKKAEFFARIPGLFHRVEVTVHA